MNNIIKNEIIKLKPNISVSSVNTYNSILKNIPRTTSTGQRKKQTKVKSETESDSDSD